MVSAKLTRAALQLRAQHQHISDIRMLPRQALTGLRRPLLAARPLGRRRWQSSIHGEHQTYFQQPPPSPRPKWRWRILRGTILALISFGVGATLGSMVVLDRLEAATGIPDIAQRLLDRARQSDTQPAREDEEDELQFRLEDVMAEAARVVEAVVQPGISNTAEITAKLMSNSSLSCNTDNISHNVQVASNVPCEDQISTGVVAYSNTENEWAFWAIYDGHAGPRTSYFLKHRLGAAILDMVGRYCLDDSGTTVPISKVQESIAAAFVAIDDNELGLAHAAKLTPEIPRMDITRTTVTLADQGSCALVATFDKKNSLLHVANAGDSRAVLGRWDPQQGKFVAYAMSNDHTGFNEAEVARLNAEHPGEDIIDPKTGRIFGLAVTRAFGDSRWKVPDSVQSMWHKHFWANPPRPNGVIKTPPYLTARPELRTVQVQEGDFLIMASDGLWDQLSNDQAVHLVQMWLDKYQPQEAAISIERQSRLVLQAKELDPTYGDDVYYDEQEKALQWRNLDKYFTVEDDNCGAHLVRNALGGNRTLLLANVLSAGPPRSRDVRDDITCSVVFFGADLSGVQSVLEPTIWPKEGLDGMGPVA